MSVKEKKLFAKKPILIVIAGNISSEFFVNEIPYFQSEGEVYVVNFGKLGKKEKEIVKRYQLRCIECSVKQLNIHVVTGIFNWMRLKHVKEELQKNRVFSLKGLKRIGYIFWYGIYSIIAETKLKECLKKEQFYLYSYWLSRPAYTASYIKSQYGNNCVYSFSRAHGYDLYKERNALNYLPFREFIGNTLDEICFISKNGMNYYKQYIAPHLERIPSLKVERLGTENSHGVKKQIKEKELITIVSCSSVIEVKRLDLIIETIHYLQTSSINVKWIHIGQGKLFKAAQRMARELLNDGSYIFTGYIDNSKILSTYQSYDVDFFINLSDSEGVPVSIMEAISIGIPVIARNVGGNSEIVDETNGCLVDHIQSEQAMKQISDFVKMRLHNTALYKEKSDSSRLRWEEYFNADKNYKQFFRNFLW